MGTNVLVVRVFSSYKRQFSKKIITLFQHCFNTDWIYYPNQYNNRCFILLALFALTACDASKTQDSSLSFIPGVLSTKFAVNNSGATTLRVDLKLPPGRGHVQPQLSLLYNSQSSNSIVGHGWNVSGLSKISRCGAKLAIDGFKGGVQYDQYDRFCLDGQRLIAVNKAYGDNESEYRTIIDTGKRVKAYYDSNGQACGAGPCYFIVKDKKGIESLYGSASGRIYASNTKNVRVWANDQTTDLNGNQIQYYYTQDPLNTGILSGAYYPSVIEYSGNPVQQQKASKQIKLNYESRSDASLRYLGGYAIKMDARLSHVDVLIDSKLAKQYQLSYLQGGTATSRLNSVRECDGQTTCLPATVFGWQIGAKQYAGEKTALANSFGRNNGWNSERGMRFLSDVNGDGRNDIVGFKDGVYVALANQNGFQAIEKWSSEFAAPAWSVSSTPRIMTDVNGDGLADIVGFGINGVQVALSTGNSFDVNSWKQKPYPYFCKSCTSDGGWLPGDTPRMMTDVNGDGLSDIVGFGIDGVYVALSEGDGFASKPVKWTDDFGKNSTTPWSESTPRLLADITGDGLVDLIGFAKDGVHVAVSGGNLQQKFYKPSWAQTPFPYFGGQQNWSNSNIRTLADVNGDGLADIVGIGRDGVFVALATGRGFAVPSKTAWNKDFKFPSGSWSVKSTPIQVSDVNADGKADIVGFGLDGVQVGISEGDKFSLKNWNQNSLPAFGKNDNGQWGDTTPRTLADINGDGLVDVIGFGMDDVKSGLVAGPYPNLINSITDGFGRKISINYLPLSNSDVYQADTLKMDLDEKMASIAALKKTQQELAKTNSNNVLGRLASIAQSAQLYPIAGVNMSSVAVRNIHGGRNQVVADYQIANVAAVNSKTVNYHYAYRYAQAKFDNEGFGWLGFRDVEKSDMQTGTLSRRSFTQLFPLTGRLLQQYSLCGNAVNFDKNCNQTDMVLAAKQLNYIAPVVVSNPRNSNAEVYQVLLTSQQTDHYNYGKYGFSLGQTYQYDQFANVLTHANLGYVDLQGKDIASNDNVYTLIEYLPVTNGPNNLVSLLKKSSQSNRGQLSQFNSGVDLALTEYTYAKDQRFNLLTKSRWDDTNQSYLTHTYDHDAFGNRTKVVDPAGGETDIVYDDQYQTFVSAIKLPKVSSAARGLCDNNTRLCEQYAYDPLSGSRISHIDENGQVFTQCVDNFGRRKINQGPVPVKPANVKADQNCLASSAFVAGEKTALTNMKTASVVSLQQHSMQQKSGLIYHQSQFLQEWPSANTGQWLEVENYFDVLGRNYHRSRQSGSQTVLVDIEYNSLNLVSEHSLPYFSGDTPIMQQSQFDIYRRLIKTNTPMEVKGVASQSINQYEYDISSEGYQTKSTQAVGSSAVYQQEFYSRFYNGTQKLNKMVVPADENATTTYQHDILGRRIAATDPVTLDNPAGLTSTVSYDSLGRNKSLFNPSHGVVTFHYNKQGQMEHKDDANGRFTFQYDAIGRTLTKVRPDGIVIDYQYDQSTPGFNNALGKISSIKQLDGNQQSISHVNYGYDVYGRKSSQKLDIAQGNQVFSEQRVFYPNGRVSEHYYPNGSIASYQYNQGQLEQLNLDQYKIASFSDYIANGQPRTVEYGNGVKRHTNYAPSQQLQSVQITAGQNVMLDLAYSWDALGQLTDIDPLKTNSQIHEQHFKYTNKRLASANGPHSYGVMQYAYDSSGNLTQKDGIDYSYTGYQVELGKKANQQVFKAAYNSAGNMTNKQSDNNSWQYTYNAENRLLTAQQVSSTSSPKVSFIYDHQGNRIYKTDSKGNQWWYLGNDYTVSEPASGNVETQLLLTALNNTVATVLGDGQTSNIRYLHNNHLSSPLFMTDQQSKVLQQWQYQPYGLSKTSQPGKTISFNGKTLDAETGLYYFGARYYDPSLGRFITADTGLAASSSRQGAFNRYAFVLNSPTNYVDPTGNVPCVPFAIGGGVLGTAGGILGGIATGLDIGGDAGWTTGTSQMVVDGALGGLAGFAGGYEGCRWFKNRFGQQTTFTQDDIDQAYGRGFRAGRGYVSDSDESSSDDGYFSDSEASDDSSILTSSNSSSSSTGDTIFSSAISNNAASSTDSTSGLLVGHSDSLLDDDSGDNDVANALSSESSSYLSESSSTNDDETCSCFTAGTLIATESGNKPIELIRPGDLVWSHNLATGQNELKPVKQLVRDSKPKPELVVLYIAGQIIQATPGHPVWLQNSQQWVAARELKLGDLITNKQGGLDAVEKIERLQGQFRVFNFEVVDNHNYFVTESGWLVHNSSCIGEEDGLGGQTEYGSGNMTSTGLDQIGADSGVEATTAMQSGVDASAATAEAAGGVVAETTAEAAASATAVDTAIEAVLSALPLLAL